MLERSRNRHTNTPGVYLMHFEGKWFLFPTVLICSLTRAMFNNSSPYNAKTTTGGGGGVGGETSFPPQSPFASGVGGQHQQQGQQQQFGSTNPFENHQQNQRARTTPTTTPFGNETSRNGGTPFGGRGVGGGSSLFTSSPAPANAPFV